MSEPVPHTVPLLSFELLDELRLRLVEQKAPVVELLSPGLDDAQLDAAFEPTGLRPSTEARTWWAWSGGVPLDAIEQPNDGSVGPGRHYAEPVKVVELYRSMRATAADAAADAATFASGTERATADWWWQPGWLPITTNGAGTTIACDCSVPDGQPSPMYAVNYGARQNFYQPSAASFGETVQWWIDALDTHAWRYDPDASRWHYDWQIVDRDRQLSGLV